MSILFVRSAHSHALEHVPSTAFVFIDFNLESRLGEPGEPPGNKIDKGLPIPQKLLKSTNNFTLQSSTSATPTIKAYSVPKFSNEVFHSHRPPRPHGQPHPRCSRNRQPPKQPMGRDNLRRRNPRSDLHSLGVCRWIKIPDQYLPLQLSTA